MPKKKQGINSKGKTYKFGYWEDPHLNSLDFWRKRSIRKYNLKQN